jgi:hypothetical protein
MFCSVDFDDANKQQYRALNNSIDTDYSVMRKEIMCNVWYYTAAG